MNILRYLPILLLSGCVSTGSNEGVACAAPSSFSQLEHLERQGCALETLLTSFDDGTEERRLSMAWELAARGDYELAASWYEQAESFAAYQELLTLYDQSGPLADDAEFLKVEVKRAQLQQAFGREVDWPQLSSAQPLYVSSTRSALHTEPDLDAPVLEALQEDDQVYLLDVVLLEASNEYWVEAYYPQTLALGWIPAQELAQQTRYVREEMATLDQFVGRAYAQQLLVGAVISAMELAPLTRQSEQDFFAGAQTQQTNAVALMQAIGQSADVCLNEVSRLEDQLGHYLMGEATKPSADITPLLSELRAALAALTGQPVTGLPDGTVNALLRKDIQQNAYSFFRIRVQGQIDQRLCFSLPNAAGRPEATETVCQSVQVIQQCINRADAVFNYLD